MKFLVLFLVALNLVGFSSQSSSNRITTNVYPCPHSGLSRLAHSWSCSKFVQCVNGYAVERDCIRGTRFSEQYQKCTFPDYSDCGVEKSPCPRWTDPEDLIFLTNQHGAVYYMCQNGEPMPMMCPINLFFNREKQVCDPDSPWDHVSGFSI